MSVFTSPQFASYCASGKDWRDTAKAVLEAMDGVYAQGGDYNVGFLYVSHHLAADLTSIYNLFRSVLGIENWVGSNGAGVCGVGEAQMDMPSISIMVGFVPEAEFCVFGPDHEEVAPWVESRDPMLGVVHANPFASDDISRDLRRLYDVSGGFLVGGLLPLYKDCAIIANGCHEAGLGGVLFSQNVSVATVVSQGCQPIGETHTITKAYEQTIYEISGLPAVNVFENDLRDHIDHRTDKDCEAFLPEHMNFEHLEIPDEFQDLFAGEVHAAFQMSECDQLDYVVRDILDISQDEGTMNVSHHANVGERILFVQRNLQSMHSDLARRILELRRRVEKQAGEFAPKGALYISCMTRGMMDLHSDRNSEMALIRDIIGDVPLTGVYAEGEISNGRLYKYTGVLTLFL